MSDEVIDVEVKEVVNDSPDQWEFEWDEGGGRCEKCRRNKYCSMKKEGCGPIKRHREKLLIRICQEDRVVFMERKMM